jgi:phosphoribosylaminoimidazole carboxylase (NCAIR synthetase)
VHWYGKIGAKIGRKLGHVTILASRDADIESIIASVNSIWQA